MNPRNLEGRLQNLEKRRSAIGASHMVTIGGSTNGAETTQLLASNGIDPNAALVVYIHRFSVSAACLPEVLQVKQL